MTKIRELLISTETNSVITEYNYFRYLSLKEQLDSDNKFYDNKLEVLVNTDNYILARQNNIPNAIWYREYTQIN